MITNEEIILKAESYVKDILEKDTTGHDFWHIDRVRKVTKTIAKEENADMFVCELAALLHDVADDKLTDNEEEALENLKTWMKNNGVSEDNRNHIFEIITTMSFKGGKNKNPMSTLEGKIVQDADRLDAIGAIGIARCMTYSGSKKRPMHNPNFIPRDEMTLEEYRNDEGTAIAHFYEKLLKLKNLMNTNAGKKLAEGRHKYMEEFLKQFYEEWEGRL